MKKVVKIGIGGPVGSGKTALLDRLCKAMRDHYRMAVVTNDIFTREDMEFLIRSEALSEDRIYGVQTGGCPHTAIREDASLNFEAIDQALSDHPDLELIFVESGGDNLAASFSPELVDASIYVMMFLEGTRFLVVAPVNRPDLLIINKIDVAPLVGASLEVMDRDSKEYEVSVLCLHKPQRQTGLDTVIRWLKPKYCWRVAPLHRC